MVNDKTYDLLIIFTNGEKQIIHNVSSYGFSETNITVFRFTKNGYANFVPAANVVFFGREFDYNNS